MIDENIIKSAKAVDISKILNEFNWHTDETGTFILCPSPQHDDKHPSVVINKAGNYCRCFTCRNGIGSDFDTINVYRNLSEKVNHRVVSFPVAVEEIIKLDGISKNHNKPTCYQNTNAIIHGTDSSPYDIALKHCKPLTGYELNYLHQRGIMFYDSYVFNKQVYTVMNIEKELQTATDKKRIAELENIKQNGKFYKGISPILQDNKIRVMHNYHKGTNFIMYQIAYSEDDVISDDFSFLEGTEREMIIKKSMDSVHYKGTLGASDFCFLTEGINNKPGNVYLCEGMEDSLSFVMAGYRSISLNSISNLQSLISYLKRSAISAKKYKYIICFDHDIAGQVATKELISFFESYNQKHIVPFKYAVCNFPKEFHDINDYWKAKVFE